MRGRVRFWGLLILWAAVAAGCRPAASGIRQATAVGTASLGGQPSPTATLPPPTVTPSPQPSPSPTLTPTPTRTPPPSPTPCAAEVCVLPWRFPLRRPIALPDSSAIAPTYPFGSDYHGLRHAHHGVDMENPRGTPVLAAADGEVVFAGTDTQTLLGPVLDFYGQAVVLRHDLAGAGQAVYTLYGHLDTVAVQVGQTVAAGTVIGTVGSRGVAVGPHLHFEVRLGENAYDAVQNPVLWLRPLAKGDGALAMRLTDGKGTPRHLTDIVVRGVDAGLPTLYPQTYATADLSGDPRLHENLALGSLPAGRYEVEITCCGRLFRRQIVIQPYRLTFVRLALP
ncbi:MAG TPA: M23 family metallopeptidase [Chloroflexi bacterium]|nr:M23 family metallopeptidase [Chloroflexota bacterium]